MCKNIQYQIIKLNKSPTDENNYIRPMQSANVLFNFMKDIDYLKLILKNKAIIPRYYEESIDYLQIEKFDKIAFPMTCFCDITLQKLVHHMEFYGSYGIGFKKDWGINQGIQPIQYINKNSVIKQDFSKIFLKALEDNLNPISELDEYKDYLLTQMLFMKPLEGRMIRDGKYVPRNFHDEKEWRYVPDIKMEPSLPLVIPIANINPKACNSYSDGMATCSKLWLHFNYENIKYLIVKSESDKLNFINFILKEIECTESEKYILLSKIIVFNEIREDW